MFEIAAFYLGAINLAAFHAFKADKDAAVKHQWRVRESTLLWLALIGGSSGAIAGQQILRHKTRKEPFRTLLRLIVAAQAIGLGVCWFQFAPR